MPMPPITHSKRNTQQEKEVKVVVPLHPKYKKYHVFQQHENEKERHALQNWEWFENDRPILQESISRRINRPQEKLMMDQGSHYRLKMENQGIVDSVKRIEDMVRGEALWKMSLRNNWERHIECNGMHSIPQTWGPEARIKKPVERIGYPNKMHTKFVYFKDNSRRDRRRSLWNEFDWYIQHIVESIDKEHSFYPSFEGLQVRGRAVTLERQPPVPVTSNTEQDEDYDYDSKSIHQDEDQFASKYELPPPAVEIVEKPKGPAAELSRQDLVFCCKPGEIDKRTVIVYNKGTTAIFYSWERRPVEPLVLPGRQKEGWRLFTVMRGTGSLLPGYARKFTFKYSSREVGTHLEKWVCRIYPKPDVPVEPVDLKGITMFEDRLRKWRNAFTRALEYREMVTGVREALSDVLTSAGKANRVPEELRKQDYLYTKAAFDFIRSNLAVSPPVFFGPKIFAELEKLNQAVSSAVPQQKVPDPPQEQVQEVVILEETDRSRRKSKKDKKAGNIPEDSNKSKRKKSKPGEDNSPAPAAEAGGGATEDSSKKKKGKKRSKDKAAEGEAEGRVETPSAAAGGKKESRRKSVRINSLGTSADALPSEAVNSEFESGAAASPPQPDASTSPIEVSPAAWAGSVSSILEAINTIPERAIRRQFKKQLSSLMETAGVPNHQTSLLLRAMYKSLHHISDDVENILETVTEESGRPIVEKLLHTYYAQIEAEQAATESVGASEAGADPEDLTWPFKDDDSDTDWLPEEEKNQVKRERANEMLGFLMKWIHILTEARCILRYGLDQAQDRISDEQASVAAMIDQKIAEYLQDSSEDACWKVFDLERKKQQLQEELVKLPPCQLPNCPNCPKPTEEQKVEDPDDDDDSGLFLPRRGMSTLL